MEALIRKVQEMRDAQKAYFRTRERKYLLKAKQLENEVDGLLAKIENLQQKIF